MSLTRSLFNEFRPFFRLFDEATRSHPSYAILNRSLDRHHFDELPYSRHPNVDLSEQGNDYIVEAEVPGVKKDNLEVRLGDGGRSLTIEGRLFTRGPPLTSSSSTPPDAAQDSNKDTGSGDVVPASTDAPMPISSERDFVGSSHFTRTIWLPRPVNASKVTANLEDGILTLRVPKADEQGSTKIDIR